jgi:hypothetical protein
LHFYNGFGLTATVGPEGNTDGLLGASMIPGKGNPVMIWISPTPAGRSDELARVRRAIDPVSGGLAGCSSDDQEVHTHVPPIRSVRREMIITTGRWLMHLCGYTNTIVRFLCDIGKMYYNPDTFNVSQILNAK